MEQVQCKECGTHVDGKRNRNGRLCYECTKRYRREYMRVRDGARRTGQCPDCGTAIMDRSVRCKPCGNRSRDQIGENNPAWKGGQSRKDGYVYLKKQVGTPGKGKGAFYWPEHHAVWERVYGKKLPKTWVIHHLNGVKDDNRPENLAAMPHHEHHSHPRKALRPYEARIHRLEQELAELRQLKLRITH